MGVGLNLAKLTPLVDRRFKVNFKTVFNISGASGITNLANRYLFFILSAYNPVDKTGSKLTQLLGSAVIHRSDIEATSLEIHDTIDDATERFKTFEAEAPQPPSLDESLDSANILAIDINPDTSEIEVSLELKNKLGQRAGLVF